MLSNGYSLYFSNAAVRVLEHPDDFAIFQYQSGPRALADLQAALTHLDNLLRRRQWRKVLNDQRQMMPFSEEERAWVNTYWQAHLDQHNHGLHAAVLMAQDVFARLAASQQRLEHQAAALNITYHLFEAEAEALAWLRQLR
jgi:hypothetical protein